MLITPIVVGAEDLRKTRGSGMARSKIQCNVGVFCLGNLFCKKSDAQLRGEGYIFKEDRNVMKHVTSADIGSR